MTWDPVGSSRKPVPITPDLAHRLPTCSSDCRGKARPDLGSVLPSRQHLSLPELLIFLSHMNRFVVLKFAAQEDQVDVVT